LNILGCQGKYGSAMIHLGGKSKAEQFEKKITKDTHAHTLHNGPWQIPYEDHRSQDIDKSPS